MRVRTFGSVDERLEMVDEGTWTRLKSLLDEAFEQRDTFFLGLVLELFHIFLATTKFEKTIDSTGKIGEEWSGDDFEKWAELGGPVFIKSVSLSFVIQRGMF